jgi:hypothetical protein
MDTADQLGLRQLNRKGHPVLKITVPNTVELFDLYAPVPPPAKGQPPVKGEWMYRLYSGYAHAKQWALTLGARAMAPSDSSGRTLALAQGQELTAVYSTHECVNAIERAIDAFEQLRR